MTAPTYEKLTAPKPGTRVTVDANGKWNIPDDPIVCLLRGDGIGQDVGSVPGITTCAVKVLDAAVAKAYGGKRKIHWFDVHAGDVARELYYPAGQGRAGRHAQRGRAAQALPARRHAARRSSITASASRAR